jgi:hypothetical protein
MSITPISRDDLCERCMQPVPRSHARCPHCGIPRLRARRYTIWLGIAGLVALVFVVLMMVKAIHDADIAAVLPQAQAADTLQSGGPETSSQPDKPSPSNR